MSGEPQHCAACGRRLLGGYRTMPIGLKPSGDEVLQGAFCVDALGCQRTAAASIGRGSNTNLPVPSSYDAIAAELSEAASLIEEGDSFEGFFEWCVPDVPEWAQRGEPEPEGWVHVPVLFRAIYRHGNTFGQGSVRIIGSLTCERWPPAA